MTIQEAVQFVRQYGLALAIDAIWENDIQANMILFRYLRFCQWDRTRGREKLALEAGRKLRESIYEYQQFN